MSMMTMTAANRPTHAYDVSTASLLCAMTAAGRQDLATYAKAAHCHDLAWFVCAAWTAEPTTSTADLLQIAEAIELAGGL